MIPDDAVLVINQEESTVRTNILPDNMVVYVCESGFPGTLDPTALAHIYNKNNPHEDSVTNTKVPAGNSGKWIKLGDTKVAVTDEVPLYIEDIRPIISEDGQAKVDSADITATLISKITYPFIVESGSSAAAHKLILAGDNGNSAPRMFYGTDAAGTMGFNPVPGKQVIP